MLEDSRKSKTCQIKEIEIETTDDLKGWETRDIINPSHVERFNDTHLASRTDNFNHMQDQFRETESVKQARERRKEHWSSHFERFWLSMTELLV